MVNLIVEGDVVGDLGEAPGVGLAYGLAKSLQDVAAIRGSEAEFVVAIEDAGGLGVDLLVQPQQAKSGFHGIQPILVVGRGLMLEVRGWPSTGICMGTVT